MERLCPGCGAIIQDSTKVCGNCGKIIPPRKTTQGTGRAMPRASQPAQRQVSTAPKQRTAPNRQPVPQKVQRTQPARPKPQPVQQRPAPQRVAQKPKPRQKKKPETLWDRLKIKKWLKIIAVVLAIYIVVSLVQIFRVKLATYDFKTTSMKMSQDNYGEAIDVFFDSGSWSYNPFTCTVKYSGLTVENDEYELKFSALGSVEVKGIEVDGEKKDKKQFETIMMGMFI